MWQALEVKRLFESSPSIAERFTFEIQTEIAKGDVVLDQHLASLAAAQPGIFTKELEVGLQVRRGRCDNLSEAEHRVVFAHI